MHTHATRSIPKPRHDSLMALLPLTGPYSRAQLEKRLRSAALTCSDEAASLRRSRSAFKSATGLPRDALPMPPAKVPTTPEGWEAEAAIYELMAELVRTWRPAARAA